MVPLWTCSLDERSDDTKGKDSFEEFFWEREYGHDGGRERERELAALMKGLGI